MKNLKKKLLIFLSISLLLVFVLISAIASFLSRNKSGNNSSCVDMGLTPVTSEVLKHEPMISKYAKEFEVKEYVPLILALVQQESGGRHVDVMQAAEGPYNNKYPKVPNGITDTEYSIWCGVQQIKDALKNAGVTSPNDIKNISLALQSYNFGNGFLTYAQERGGYTKEIAYEFSKIWAAKMGWKSYGDPEYVPHVLRYYNTDSVLSCSESTTNFKGKGKLKSVVDIALKQQGKIYIWGASGPDTFDCSGLVYYAYFHSGYNHVRTTAQGYYNISTKTTSPVPGDMVFFKKGSAEIHHIGIYLGDGKMVHAPQTGDVVKIADLNTSYWQSTIYGYGRISW